MANENETDDRGARIKELEGLLSAAVDASALQAKAHDQLMGDFRSAVADLKAANERLETSKKRASKLEAALKDREKQTNDGVQVIANVVARDHVVWQGTSYQIIGDFRADNTFSEVKRGHCPEGVTLIAIEKRH